MMSKTPKRAKPEIKSQTAFRGLAAMMVMIVHFVILKDDGKSAAVTVFDFGDNIELVLDTFFVLSGFIMSYIYLDTFKDKVKPERTLKFLAHRFSRLYPLHIFALLVLMAERGSQVVLASFVPFFGDRGPATFFNGFDTPYSLLTNIFIVHAWGFGDKLSWNYPSWTVSAEFAAYLTFPLLCLVIGRLGKLGAALLMAAGFAGYVALNAEYGTIGIPGVIGALRCIPGFAIGVGVYGLSVGLRLPSDRLLGVLQIAAVAAMLLGYAVIDNQVLIIALICLVVIVTTENRGVLVNALCWQPLQYLGRISFTIYIMHVVAGNAISPIMRLVGGVAGVGDATWWLYAGIVAKIVATVVASDLAWRFVEMPARGVVEGLLIRRKPAKTWETLAPRRPVRPTP